MTCYIANHQKTRRVLQKREAELEHAIKHDLSRDKLLKAAETLREARLKVFKSDFSARSVLPASAWVPNAEAKQWQSMPADEIIRTYRMKAQPNKPSESSR